MARLHQTNECSLRVSHARLLHYHSFNERNDMNTSVNDANEIFENRVYRKQKYVFPIVST